jgi:hypothetical protein
MLPAQTHSPQTAAARTFGLPLRALLLSGLMSLWVHRIVAGPVCPRP